MINDGTVSFRVIDQKQDGTDIDVLRKEIEELKKKVSDEENFTIIYPNKGSEEHPANIKSNQRYVENNPFPGYHVLCEVQLLFTGKWGSPGTFYAYRDGGIYGTSAHQLNQDKIVIRTGEYVAISPTQGGAPFDLEGPDVEVEAAPCRVLVYKLGKIKE